jgi:hypothetical protein
MLCMLHINSDTILTSQPADIEELYKLGEKEQACSYYAARRAAPQAVIVFSATGVFFCGC